MVAGYQKIGRRISEHLRKKGIRKPPTTDLCKAAKEVACQIGAEVMAKALTHSILCTACTMVVTLTIAPKISPFSSSQNGKWSKIRQNLHNNQQPENSITP
jgi:hypothetical protein